MNVLILTFIVVFNFLQSSEKLFVACEGAYYDGQGSLSIINEDGEVDQIQNLGNTVQSITVYDNHLFIIANGSSLIHVFDINDEGNLSLNNTINLNSSGPRYMLIHEESNSAYITNWYTQDIKIMNLETFEITNSIPVNGLPEDIIFDGEYIWVSITANADWTDGSTVIKLNPADNIIAEYEVGYGPGDLLFHNNSIYVSRTYYDADWNAFYGTSRIDENENITIAEYGVGMPCGGSLTTHNNDVYRSYNGGIAPLDDELGILSDQQLGDLGFLNVYDVKSINNKIYFAVTDYNTLNQVVILDEGGSEIGTYDVGIIPTDFAVWDNSVLNNDNDFLSNFQILGAYPNPFNPNTNFDINIPEAGYLSVNIYDISGKLVTNITNDYYLPNNYSFNWNASKLSSGLYIINATLNNYTISYNITLLK
tara:strand:- start:289 stop:1557 length:1269 start_codon:yes stop_codon:yes gene_type:complete